MDFLRLSETGQHCLPNTIVSILNQVLPFCPWLMIQKQTTLFAEQCWPLSPRLKRLFRCLLEIVNDKVRGKGFFI